MEKMKWHLKNEVTADVNEAGERRMEVCSKNRVNSGEVSDS